MILIIILYALFALSVFISKVIFSYSSPIFYIGARMSIAGMILLAYQYFFAREHFVFKKETFLALCASRLLWYLFYLYHPFLGFN